MNEESIKKISNLYAAFNKIAASLLALYCIGIGIYKGLISNSTTEFISWVLGGFAGGLVIITIFIAVDFGLTVWDKSTNLLTNHIRKYPYLRFWVVFPSILFSVYATYLVIRYLETDLSLRIFIGIYLLFILPAAIISLVRDDLKQEHTRLSKSVSREIRIQNPQAAIENAFTHFEDHLLKRLSVNSTLYGNKLIKTAFEGETSRLVYKSDGKDYTGHLNNLMSGAYSVLRNPRHHKLVDDDEQKAQTIISFVELLIDFVDSSEARDNNKLEAGL